ncbi:MAG TPA: hypothetical protein VLE47_03245 [Candidatus Saccharimonadales bacterium]|nr:hypothetical protein [Candidatus Saccharimonadales bacterium]
MKWIVLVVALSLSIFAFACKDGSKTKTTDGNVLSANTGPKNGSGSEESLECPKSFEYDADTKERAALITACQRADNLKVAVDFTKLEVEKDSARNATIRLVGNATECPVDCPLEVEITLDVFKQSNGKWLATANTYLNESKESVANKQAAKIEQLNAVEITFSGSSLRMEQYGQIRKDFVYSNVNGLNDILGTSFNIEIKVKSPTDSREFIYQSNDLTGKFNSFEGSFDEGTTAKIIAYRVGLIPLHGDDIWGDWKEVN